MLISLDRIQQGFFVYSEKKPNPNRHLEFQI